MQLKVDFHTHTSDDPVDRIPHTTAALIERAASLGYHALAITLHNKCLDLAPFESHARQHDVVLIRGIERTIQGRHVLLINFGTDTERVGSFEELAALKARESGVVIAPHVFYPVGHSLGGALLDRYSGLVDAVEVNAMYARGLNFNRQAIAWANRHGKPLVGNGDVHRLAQLGSTYTLVESEPNPDAICEAVRRGRVQVVTQPLGWLTAARIAGDIVLSEVLTNV
jgi:predicted metal-dependent phosphoesterase TrpH